MSCVMLLVIFDFFGLGPGLNKACDLWRDCDDKLNGDLQVREVWQPQVNAVFDVRVVDTDAPS